MRSTRTVPFVACLLAACESNGGMDAPPSHVAIDAPSDAGATQSVALLGFA